MHCEYYQPQFAEPLGHFWADAAGILSMSTLSESKDNYADRLETLPSAKTVLEMSLSNH